MEDLSGDDELNEQQVNLLVRTKMYQNCGYIRPVLFLCFKEQLLLKIVKTWRSFRFS